MQPTSDFSSHPSPENPFEVSFSDGSPSLFLAPHTVDKIETLRLSLLFKEGVYQKFNCTICSSDDFKKVYQLIQEPFQLNQLLTEEEKQTPWIYEELEQIISFFYPNLYHSKVARIILEQFSHLSLDQAHHILTVPCDQIHTLSLFAQKRIRDTLYFSTHEEAEQHFLAEKGAMQNYAQLKIRLKSLQEEAEIKECLEKIEKVHNQLLTLKEDFNRLKHSPIGLQNASRYAGYVNIFFRTEALKAQAKLHHYIQKIKEGLEIYGWDLKDHPLTEYLIGPKAFLLSHYGFVPVLIKVEKKDNHKVTEELNCQFHCIPDLAGTYNTSKENHKFCGTVTIPMNIQDPCKLEEHFRTFLAPSRHMFRLFPDAEIPSIPKKLLPLDQTPKTYVAYACDEEDVNNLNHNFELIQQFKPAMKDLYFPLKNSTNSFTNRLNLDFKVWKHSGGGQFNLSLQRNHSMGYCRYLANQAKKNLKVYKKRVISLLTEVEANLMRQDLLDHLVGPKNFLFSYYGIIAANGPIKDAYAFRYMPSACNTLRFHQGRSYLGSSSPHLGYSLHNLGPKALEEEIRTDLSSGSKKIAVAEIYPNWLIEKEEVTCPITKELKVLQEETLPKLACWKQLNEKEQWAVIEKIYLYNEWDQYSVKIHQMHLTDIPTMDQSKIYVIKGVIRVERLGELPFHFNTHDFHLVIKSPVIINPDLTSTKNCLKKGLESCFPRKNYLLNFQPIG